MESMMYSEGWTGLANMVRKARKERCSDGGKESMWIFVHLEEQACLNVGLHENTQGRVEPSPQDILFVCLFISEFCLG